MTGFAVIVGLNKVDPKKYNGWEGLVPSRERSVDKMKEILLSMSFLEKDITTLKTEQATCQAVQDELIKVGKQAKKGDIVVFYFAGHGGERPDADGNEDTKKDQTLCCYDGALLDDTLGGIWSNVSSFNKHGLRVVALTDTCHSGTNIFSISGKQFISIFPTLGLKAVSSFNPMMIHIAACDDKQFSYNIPGENGEESPDSFFTKAVKEVLDDGTFTGSHYQLYEELKGEVDRLVEEYDLSSSLSGDSGKPKKPVPAMPGQTVQWHSYGRYATELEKKMFDFFMYEQPAFSIDFPKFTPYLLPSEVSANLEKELISELAVGEASRDETKGDGIPSPRFSSRI
jgi:hypothetical protein